MSDITGMRAGLQDVREGKEAVLFLKKKNQKNFFPFGFGSRRRAAV
jgi:hypothetical protein